MPARSTKGSMTLSKQICEQIPAHVVPKLARDYGIDARQFSAWSHVVSQIYGQVMHTVGLNDFCDGLGRQVGSRGSRDRQSINLNCKPLPACVFCSDGGEAALRSAGAMLPP